MNRHRLVGLSCLLAGYFSARCIHWDLQPSASSWVLAFHLFGAAWFTGLGIYLLLFPKSRRL